jgi:hypothetical protein
VCCDQCHECVVCGLLCRGGGGLSSLVQKFRLANNGPGSPRTPPVPDMSWSQRCDFIRSKYGVSDGDPDAQPLPRSVSAVCPPSPHVYVPYSPYPHVHVPYSPSPHVHVPYSPYPHVHAPFSTQWPFPSMPYCPYPLVNTHCEPLGGPFTLPPCFFSRHMPVSRTRVCCVSYAYVVFRARVCCAPYALC